MTERDVERVVAAKSFAARAAARCRCRRRCEAFQMQVLGKRFTVPARAELSIEHEVGADGEASLGS